VSAAHDVIDISSDDLARTIWHEIAPTLQSLGLDAAIDRQPEARVVKEKRATIKQAANPQPLPPLRPLANLALAGDWLGSLPATIESAVVSGEEAVAALRHARGMLPVSRTNLQRRENAA
ncbi:MAG: hypothetical protein K0Q80_2299, partial [Microvirga sp.]|nr:hypothetical protein [Microvirga sp.]